MAHDVFISYSTEDKPAADAVCARLEKSDVRCWIAPRDIMPGADWGESIVNGIRSSRVLLLVFSTNANKSRQIKREVEIAADGGVTIVPLRIENILPTESFKYFLGNIHWLDALTPPLEKHLQEVAAKVKAILNTESVSPPEKADRPSAETLKVVYPLAPKPAEPEREKPPPPSSGGTEGKSPSKQAIALLAIAAALVVGGLIYVAIRASRSPPPHPAPVAAVTSTSPPVIATPSTEEKKTEAPAGNLGRNLLTNGSFESGTFVRGPDFISLAPGSTAIDGWTTFNAELAWGTTPNSANIIASDGARFLDLTGFHDSSPYGGVTQTVATTIGKRYRLSFDLGTQEDDRIYRGPISVSATAGVITIPFTFNPSGAGTQWRSFSFDFTAASATTPISILGIRSAGGSYIGLDRVSVSELAP